MELINVVRREGHGLADVDDAPGDTEVAQLARRQHAVALGERPLDVGIDGVDVGVGGIGRAPEDAVLDQSGMNGGLDITRNAEPRDRHRVRVDAELLLGLHRRRHAATDDPDAGGRLVQERLEELGRAAAERAVGEALAAAELDPLVGNWIRTYNALFKVPVLEAPSFDGTRAVSRSFQLEIDETIDTLISAFGVDVIPLDPLDRDGWIPTVMRTLDLPLKPPQIDLFGATAVSG